MRGIIPLLERVGSGSPPGQDNGKTDSLDKLGSDADANGVNRSLLGEDLRDITGSRGSEEDETAEISSALVAQGTGGVDQSTDTIRLEGGADERRTPGESSTGSLLGSDELLLGVGDLGALVGLAEDGGEDRKLDAVVEGSAEGNSRRLMVLVL